MKAHAWCLLYVRHVVDINSLNPCTDSLKQGVISPILQKWKLRPGAICCPGTRTGGNGVGWVERATLYFLSHLDILRSGRDTAT